MVDHFDDILFSHIFDKIKLFMEQIGLKLESHPNSEWWTNFIVQTQIYIYLILIAILLTNYDRISNRHRKLIKGIR